MWTWLHHNHVWALSFPKVHAHSWRKNSSDLNSSFRPPFPSMSPNHASNPRTFVTRQFIYLGSISNRASSVICIILLKKYHMQLYLSRGIMTRHICQASLCCYLVTCSTGKRRKFWHQLLTSNSNDNRNEQHICFLRHVPCTMDSFQSSLQTKPQYVSCMGWQMSSTSRIFHAVDILSTGQMHVGSMQSFTKSFEPIHQLMQSLPKLQS